MDEKKSEMLLSYIEFKGKLYANLKMKKLYHIYIYIFYIFKKIDSIEHNVRVLNSWLAKIECREKQKDSIRPYSYSYERNLNIIKVQTNFLRIFLLYL